MSENGDLGATQRGLWGFDRARGDDVGVIVFRAGDTITCHHEIPKGSDFRLFGGTVLVAGPSHPPYRVHWNGDIEELRQ